MRAGAGTGSFAEYALHMAVFWLLIVPVVLAFSVLVWRRFGAWIEARHPTARVITFPTRSADVIELYPNERGSA